MVGVAAVEPDPPEARYLREELVSAIAENERIAPSVLAAMRRIPRHWFVPGAPLMEAYLDDPVPIGHGQTISQPTIVAMMSDALELRGGERVLEIGTGSGYQAAILAALGARVYSIEVVPELAARAARVLREHGFEDVSVRAGDGYAGWPEEAPFDRIILTAAPPELPGALVDQLAEGGILVAPVGDDDQWLVRIVKKDGSLRRELLEPVRFVPMVPGR